MKNRSSKVYVFGDTDTTVFPVSMDTDEGNLDYVGVAFSNKKFLVGTAPVVQDSDLVLGFKTTHSINVLISRLEQIREVLSEATEG